MWPATTKGTKWADCKLKFRNATSGYLCKKKVLCHTVGKRKRCSFQIYNVPIFQCCHLSITITCILVLRDSTKRVITAVFDPSNPLLPEKRSIRLENWTLHPCTVRKHTKKLWAFLDHFFTYSGAQKSKKRGITAVFDPANPANPPPSRKTKCTTWKWDQVLMYGHKTH